MSNLYRYRKLNSLIGKHQELEKQEIYLSAPGELNDPMEGYKDVFWLGDPVLWRNLLRHYLFCLSEVVLQCLLLPDDSDEDPKIPVMATKNELPTEAYKDTVAEATKTFLESAPLVELVRHLSALALPLRREGVLSYLLQIHLIAVRSIYAVFQRRGFVPLESTLTFSGIDDDKVVARLRQLDEARARLDPKDGADRFEALLGATSHVAEQLQIGIAYKSRATPNAKKKTFVLLHFPGNYLNEVTNNLIHPRWYTACFSSNCTDASMWGTYGDGHAGAVLKFDTGPEGAPTLRLEGAIGSSWSKGVEGQRILREERDYPLHKVEYTDRAPEVDFFRFLGRLPAPELENSWLSDETGAKSERLRDVFKDIDGWRRALWEIVQRSAITKLRDWGHEDEYRLVRVDSLDLVEQNRSLKYRFASLQGIIFGIGTTLQDKFKVMEIVERKCVAEGRTTFEFLQARYNRRTGKVDILSGV